VKKQFAFVAIAAAIALVAGVYLMGTGESKVAAGGSGGIGKELATGTMAAFVFKPQRRPVPEVKFTDAAGKSLTLAGWKGRIVLVNLWATWCAPCRKEMPALASLQSDMGGKDFEVIAISVDRKGVEKSSEFLKEIGVTALTLYADPSTEALNTLQGVGLPATVLIDRGGSPRANSSTAPASSFVFGSGTESRVAGAGHVRSLRNSPPST
jgi:thiol-disulfide isomerase/thioredoxin